MLCPYKNQSWKSCSKFLLRLACTTMTSTLLTAQDFDLAWKVIPKSFKGDNIVQLAKSLNTKKGEFESTINFNERIKILVPEGKTYTFLCSVNPFSSDYDADSQAFLLSVPSYEAHLTVFKVDQNGKSWSGTNAFGVKKKVKELKVIEYALAPIALNGYSHIKFQFQSSIAKAKEIKKDLGIALIAKLVPSPHFGKTYNSMPNPYFSESTFYSQATTSRPLEYLSYSYLLTAEIQKVVVYQKSNREILWVASFTE